MRCASSCATRWASASPTRGRRPIARCRRSEPYRFEAAQIGRRTLKNLALAYLLAGGGEEGRASCLAQFRGADNMTDAIAALGLLAESDLPERAAALADFYARWRDDALVVDKWFALQAMAQRPDALEVVTGLLATRRSRSPTPTACAP